MSGDLLLRFGHWKQQSPSPSLYWLAPGRGGRLSAHFSGSKVCIFPGTVCVLLFQFPINSAAFKCLYFRKNLNPACFQKPWISMVVFCHLFPAGTPGLWTTCNSDMPHAPAWPPNPLAFPSPLHPGDTYQPTSRFEQGFFLCGHSRDGYSFLTWFLEL